MTTSRVPSSARSLHRTGRHSPLGNSLPVAGETGTLANRFVAGPAKGRLRTKTGTLNTVSAAAGYVDTIPGTTLTFSYIATGATVNTSLLRIQDDLGAALVRYPEGPSLSQLGPQGG